MNNRIEELCEYYHKICDGLPFECNIDITVEDMVDILNEVEKLKRNEKYANEYISNVNIELLKTRDELFLLKKGI